MHPASHAKAKQSSPRPFFNSLPKKVQMVPTSQGTLFFNKVKKNWITEWHLNYVFKVTFHKYFDETPRNLGVDFKLEYLVENLNSLKNLLLKGLKKAVFDNLVTLSL